MHRTTPGLRGNVRHQMSVPSLSESSRRWAMNDDAPGRRTRRRVIAAATIAIVSTALVSAAASHETAVIAIIHPMQPIGNIDCCH
jgi:hypothetical protein